MRSAAPRNGMIGSRREEYAHASATSRARNPRVSPSAHRQTVNRVPDTSTDLVPPFVRGKWLEWKGAVSAARNTRRSARSFPPRIGRREISRGGGSASGRAADRPPDHAQTQPLQDRAAAVSGSVSPVPAKPDLEPAWLYRAGRSSVR